MKLCEELIRKNPNVPEYQALRGQTLVRAAWSNEMAFAKIERKSYCGQAIDIQSTLAKQYPDVLLYQFNLIQTIQITVDLLVEIKRPEAAKEFLILALDHLGRIDQREEIRSAIQSAQFRFRERLKTLE